MIVLREHHALHHRWPDPGISWMCPYECGKLVKAYNHKNASAMINKYNK
jgi:hypothetical protein